MVIDVTCVSAAPPNLTQGDKIPEGANHDWNLGAIGARGWMFSDKLVTSEARQIAIVSVDAGSPADGVLAVAPRLREASPGPGRGSP